MTPTQRAAMHAALAFIQDIDLDDNNRDILSSSQCEALDASRNALRAALAEPVVEPFAWCALQSSGKRLAYFEGIPLFKVGPVGDADHQTPLYTSPPPPAEVPLLTLDEIRKVADKADEGQESTEFMLAFARAIEALARQKAGLK